MLESIFPYITSYLIAQFILEESYPDIPKELNSIRIMEDGIVSLFIRYIFYLLSELTLLNINESLTLIGMFWIVLKITWCH